MLTTRLTIALGIDAPIVMAPMGSQLPTRHSRPPFAKPEVLGTLGAMRAQPDDLRQQIARVRQNNSRPFGVGFITHLLGEDPPHLRVALDERVPVIALSFGDPSPIIPLAKSAGAKIICQVQSFDLARRAVDAGADIICVQGDESGGHTGRENLIPFLVQAVDAFLHVPVIAVRRDHVWPQSWRPSWLQALKAHGSAPPSWPAQRPSTSIQRHVRPSLPPMAATPFSVPRPTTSSIRANRGPGWPAGVAVRHRPNEITRTWAGREEDLLTDHRAVDDYNQRYPTAILPSPCSLWPRCWLDQGSDERQADD